MHLICGISFGLHLKLFTNFNIIFVGCSKRFCCPTFVPTVPLCVPLRLGRGVCTQHPTHSTPRPRSTSGPVQSRRAGSAPQGTAQECGAALKQGGTGPAEKCPASFLQMDSPRHRSLCSSDTLAKLSQPRLQGLTVMWAPSPSPAHALRTFTTASWAPAVRAPAPSFSSHALLSEGAKQRYQIF